MAGKDTQDEIVITEADLLAEIAAAWMPVRYSDRQPDEVTVSMMMPEWGLSRSVTRARLNSMVARGIMTTREGVKNNQKCVWYRKVKK